MSPFEDVFDRINRIFSTLHNDFMPEYDDLNADVMQDEDHIYYTIQIGKEITSDDIIITTINNNINLVILGKEYNILPSALLKPSETKTTFINGVLDIIVTKDKT